MIFRTNRLQARLLPNITNTMKPKEYIPFAIVIIMAVVISGHIFSSRPSPEEMRQIQEDKKALKVAFDKNFSEISFFSIVADKERKVFRRSIGNTLFYVELKHLNTPSVPQGVSDTTFLYKLDGPELGQIVFAGLEGRGLMKGDTLEKQAGMSDVIRRNIKGRRDTLTLSWRLF